MVGLFETAPIFGAVSFLGIFAKVHTPITYIVVSLFLLQLSACDWGDDKADKVSEKVDEGVQIVQDELVEHVIAPLLQPVVEGIFEVFAEDTLPPEPCAGPDKIVPIAANHPKLNNFTKHIVLTTPDSILSQVDQSFYIYETQDRMPLYFPYYLDYSETLGFFNLRKNYCDYSRLDSFNYRVNIDEIDQIQLIDQWLAVRTYDDDASFMSAEKFPIRYWLINLDTDDIYEFKTEAELQESAKAAHDLSIELLWHSEFVEFYEHGDFSQ